MVVEDSGLFPPEGAEYEEAQLERKIAEQMGSWFTAVQKQADVSGIKLELDAEKLDANIRRLMERLIKDGEVGTFHLDEENRLQLIRDSKKSSS